jgi:hypothetical protein
LGGKKNKPLVFRGIIRLGFDSGRFSGDILALDSLYRKDVYGPVSSFSTTRIEVTCRAVTCDTQCITKQRAIAALIDAPHTTHRAVLLQNKTCLILFIEHQTNQ